MSEGFVQSSLNAAMSRIQAAVAAAAERLAEALALATPPAGLTRHDAVVMLADLRRRMAVFNMEFAGALREKILAETLPRREARRTLSSTSWESLSLVGDDEVDERVNAERLSMEIAHGCEWELRELDSHVGALLQLGHPDPSHNPLRPEIVALALLRAVQALTEDPAHRKLLARELGRQVAPAMRQCYADIVGDLRVKGVRASGLAVRTVQGPGNDLPREALREGGGYQTTGFGSSQMHSGRDLHGAMTPVGPSFASTGGPRPTGAGLPSGSAPRASGSPDAPMLEMLRRLAFMNVGIAGTADAGAASGGSPAVTTGTGFGSSGTAAPGPLGGAPSDLGGFGNMMAVNLIRQHRDELVRASTGALDHMVIDVVGTMFDHLLSDSKVPPQLARQIARLQMPVLRAALKDMDFFRSRRHPVRRFVNRIGSLAAGYEDLEEGPGLEFIERVRELVQEIVEGDFDQMDLYDTKLQAIEALIRDQSARDVGSHAQVAAVLDGRETRLRIQQRYMRELRLKLEPLELPLYLAEFLSQVWSQVHVQLAASGASSEQIQRMHRVGRELVLSVQPKGEPAQRKEFLLKLPQLMKDLNEGLTLIRWPESAKKEFYSKLLPAHAESLKSAPLTDFMQRQLKFKLDQVDKVGIPSERDLTPSVQAQLPPAEEHAAPLEFTPEEAERVNLVQESAVDWDGEIDIDLDEADPRTTTTSSGTGSGSSFASSGEVDIELDPLLPAEGATPTHGPQLMHHLQPGIAYRMHLEGRWQRVRLNWVSPGRAFFVFTHGKAHEKTISMTARMLSRMCESERFRAFEQAELIERATARARKQLAQLTAASRQGALNSRQ